MAKPNTFAFLYGRLGFLLKVLGLGPAFTGIAVNEDFVKVRFSWAFSAKIPRGSIERVEYDYDFIGGIGVHGAHGTWLVNGSANGLIAIDVVPRGRAFVIGFPVRLSRLRVSVEDPNSLIAAINSR